MLAYPTFVARVREYGVGTFERYLKSIYKFTILWAKQVPLLPQLCILTVDSLWLHIHTKDCITIILPPVIATVLAMVVTKYLDSLEAMLLGTNLVKLQPLSISFIS